MYEDIDYLFKICIIGDPEVGKTSLMRTFLYPDHPINTLGAQDIGPHFRKIVIICSKEHRHPICLQIWDLFNTPHPAMMRIPFLLGAFGIIGVFDVTRPTTLTSLMQWMEKAYQSCKRPPIMMVVGNKVDLREVLKNNNRDEVIDFETGRNFSFQIASKLSLNIVLYQETTLLPDKDAEAVIEVFRRLGKEIIELAESVEVPET